jgi:hypothetical protein
MTSRRIDGFISKHHDEVVYHVICPQEKSCFEASVYPVILNAFTFLDSMAEH